MKKLISIIMVLALILAMSTTAFAAQFTQLTINDNDDRTYAGYQLLTLTTSLKQNHTNHDAAHSDSCYNYAYTVNKKYREILWAETFANGSDDIWGNKGKPNSVDSTGITTAQKDAWIMAYLNEQESDENGTYKSMRDVADRLYRAIKAKNVEADAKNLTGNNDQIAQGYWIFADVTGFDPDDNYKANSLVMVDTAGQDPVVITPKTALPTIEKKVKDINNSTDGDITDNAWQDSADHDMGDKVPFKLTATLPSNVKNYTSYALTFHDTLSDGLKFDETSVRVYMYNSKADAEADKKLESPAKNVTANFQVETKGLTDGCTFEIACNNVLGIKDVTVTKDTAFVVYYEVTLMENATVGAEGNSNEVYLEFSNDPYGTGTGETAPDKVKVFTYKVVINKTDADNEPLKGAGFILYKKNAAGEYVAIGEELKSDNMTTFEWVGLDDGDYKLEEKTVPAGYNKMNDIEFTVSATHDLESENPTLTELKGGNLGTGEVKTGAIVKDIVNYTGTVLPETGAQGTFFLICGGSILVVLAAVFMITRKKMSVFEE